MWKLCVEFENASWIDQGEFRNSLEGWTDEEGLSLGKNSSTIRVSAGLQQRLRISQLQSHIDPQVRFGQSKVSSQWKTIPK